MRLIPYLCSYLFCDVKVRQDNDVNKVCSKVSAIYNLFLIIVCETSIFYKSLIFKEAHSLKVCNIKN
jgi:hypothetical protein